MAEIEFKDKTSQLKEQRQKPKCVDGYSCGNACISKANVCTGKISKDIADAVIAAAKGKAIASGASSITDEEADAVLAAYELKSYKDKTKVKPETRKDELREYEVREELGGGNFGETVITDRGTVVKKLDKDAVEEAGASVEQMVDGEFKGLEKLYELDLGPKPIAYDLDSGLIEMDLVEGTPAFKHKDKNKVLEAAASRLMTLHRKGWVHGDPHDRNVYETKDGSIKFIDAGATGAVGKTIDLEESARTGYHDLETLLPASSPTLKAVRAELAMSLQAYDRQSLNDPEAASLALHADYLTALDKLKF